MSLAAALRPWHHPVVRFDQFTVALLITNPDGPVLTDEQENALQEAHMAHLADLHDAGHLIAAGPLMDAPDRHYRGLSILSVDVATALELKGEDPAVRAGKFIVKAMPWMVPAGAIVAGESRFPRTIAEATGD
jgi:uncharacterized protein YciI